MRRTILIFASLSLLTACGKFSTSISEENRNPLTALRYGEALANTMADLVIKNDPLVREPGKEPLIQAQIARGKTVAADAHNRIALGMMGAFISMKEDVTGTVLFVPGSLFFSPDFITEPGPALRVYLTTVVDPRDVPFPDETALDLGPLQSVFGAQEYGVPDVEKPERYRTAVLLDTTFNRLYAFAQLSK